MLWLDALNEKYDSEEECSEQTLKIQCLRILETSNITSICSYDGKFNKKLDIRTVEIELLLTRFFLQTKKKIGAFNFLFSDSSVTSLSAQDVEYLFKKVSANITSFLTSKYGMRLLPTLLKNNFTLGLDGLLFINEDYAPESLLYRKIICLLMDYK